MIPVKFHNVKGYLNYYSPNEVVEISNKLELILKKYDLIIVKPGMIRRLTDKHKQLLKLLLNNMVTAETSYRLTTLTSGIYKSSDELISLYNLVREYKKKYHHKEQNTSKEKLLEVTFKYPGKKLTITDRKMTDWINEQLLNEIERMNLPSTFGELRFIARANDNPEVLEMLKERAVRKPLPRSKVIYYYCQSIVTYLTENLSLNNDSKYLTDDIVKLLYELLMIMKVEDNNQTPLSHETDYPLPSKVDWLRKLLNRYHNI